MHQPECTSFVGEKHNSATVQLLLIYLNMSAVGLCVRKFSGTLGVLNLFPSEQQHESRIKQLQGLTIRQSSLSFVVMPFNILLQIPLVSKAGQVICSP